MHKSHVKCKIVLFPCSRCVNRSVINHQFS